MTPNPPHEMASPPSIQPGDRIHVIAPSGPFDRENFELGLGLLTTRYDVQCREDVYSRTGYLAGSDGRRIEELQRAMDDSRAKAVVAARGGFGATRLLPSLDPAGLRKSPKWLVGFSDVTALHAWWSCHGVMSVHGAMVARLGDELSNDVARKPPRVIPDVPCGSATMDRWCSVLEGAPVSLQGTSFRAGHAEGPLLGGNLAVLAALLGTPYAPVVDGAILLLEDVGEQPYRVDRMLTSLHQAGWFDRVAGVALGSFERCGPGADGVKVESVLKERFAALGKPTVFDLPVGHGPRNESVRLGARAVLDGDSGKLTQGAIGGRP